MLLHLPLSLSLCIRLHTVQGIEPCWAEHRSNGRYCPHALALLQQAGLFHPRRRWCLGPSASRKPTALSLQGQEETHPLRRHPQFHPTQGGTPKVLWVYRGRTETARSKRSHVWKSQVDGNGWTTFPVRIQAIASDTAKIIIIGTFTQ